MSGVGPRTPEAVSKQLACMGAMHFVICHYEQKSTRTPLTLDELDIFGQCHEALGQMWGHLVAALPAFSMHCIKTFGYDRAFEICLERAKWCLARIQHGIHPMALWRNADDHDDDLIQKPTPPSTPNPEPLPPSNPISGRELIDTSPILGVRELPGQRMIPTGVVFPMLVLTSIDLNFYSSIGWQWKKIQPFLNNAVMRMG